MGFEKKIFKNASNFDTWYLRFRVKNLWSVFKTHQRVYTLIDIKEPFVQYQQACAKQSNSLRVNQKADLRRFGKMHHGLEKN